MLRKKKKLISLFFLKFIFFSGYSYAQSEEISNLSFNSNPTETDFLNQENNLSNISLHSKLNKSTYEIILKMNDLSYTFANQHIDTDPNKQRLHEERFDSISDDLAQNGWSNISTLFGANGANNQDQDAICVITYNEIENTVIVAFHGSRNGSKNPIWNNGNGDWGTNYSFYSSQGNIPTSQGGVGIEYMPDQVFVHTGFGKNFQSVQNTINEKITSILRSFTPSQRAQTIIIFTGHSKGAAIASIAAPTVKSYLSTLFDELGAIHVSAILFSAPLAFNGDDSRAWVYSQISKKDIFRINVHGDPTPLTPLRSLGFKSIGLLFLDNIKDVATRVKNEYQQSIESWWGISNWAAYHYVSPFRNSNLEFTPSMVVQYEELSQALQQGRDHLKSRNEDFMANDILESLAQSNK